MDTASFPTAPGTCFKFTVASAEQAAALIREKLGERARVLSVRTVQRGGITGLFASPKLEVIAQIPEAEKLGDPEADSAARKLAPADKATALAAGGAVLQPALEHAGARVKAPRSFHAPRMNLTELLRRAGLSEQLLMRLFESPAWLALNELPLHRALVETGRHLGELGAARHDRAPLTRAAFIGTNGVGRTTALCKWLATEVFRHARLGHVVTAEFDRPNPAGPLPVFCEALGVPMVHFPASTQPATPGGFVFVDLPGLSLRNPADNAAIAEFLAREKIEQRVLVLNAAYEAGALRAAYTAGRALGATHVVFTHLDEVAQWGRLWDYLLDGELEPLFLATGPSLTGDCELDAFDAVARRTLPALAPGEDGPAPGAAETVTLNTAA
jgi:flagellar biosynthesis protein FlhF